MSLCIMYKHVMHAQVFSEFFDKIIEKRHDGYKPDGKQEIDRDPSKIPGGCCLDEE